MKSQGRQRKILFTTVCKPGKDRYDHFLLNTNRKIFRYSLPRISSFGLRFIQWNIPDIDILEYPNWDEYSKAIRGYDIVGFSFYMDETEEILKMAHHAREQGVKEIWAGNYGAMTPEISPHFDRVFIGYSERDLAGLLGADASRLKHPPLVMYVSLPFGLKVNTIGILFTARGCPMKCTFCQTPYFVPQIQKVPLDAIKDVLEIYRSRKIQEVVILDENFGILPQYADEVTRLLHEYGFYWFGMIRADQIAANIDTWIDRGMLGALIGIESFRPESLNTLHKGEDVRIVEKALLKLNSRDIFTVGYYMIGYEQDSVPSIIEDLKRLRSYRLDISQICVMTPLPMTPLWDEIKSRYGIIDQDYHHFDTKHLVWKHPRISPDEMISLLGLGFKLVYPRRRVFQTASKFIRRYIKDKGYIKGIFYLMKKLIIANTFDYHQSR